MTRAVVLWAVCTWVQSFLSDPFRIAVYFNLLETVLDRNDAPTAHEDFALLNAAKDALLHSMFRLRYEMHLAARERPEECGSS